MKSETFFLIDICGTIYRSNTTFDFLRFYFAGERWFQRMQSIRKYRIVGFVNMIIHRWFYIDLIRHYAISKLRGYTKQQLADMTTLFYDKYLSSVINPSVVEIINQKRQEGTKLIIVSATLDCISKEVASRLNISHQYSSELDYKDGVCQGRLMTDLLATKENKMRSMGVDLSNCEVITDNYSDADIISQAKYAYLIQYNDKRDRWTHYLDKETLLKCEFIRI